MARARRQVREGKKRNYYDWEGTFLALTTLTSGVIAEFVLFTGDKAETLVRIRGWTLAQLAVSGSAAGDAAVVGFGIIIAPAGASVAVSSLTEPGANWWYHEQVILQTQGAVGGVSVNGDLSGQRTLIDNKAMRKLREDENIFLVVENVNLVGAPGVQVSATIRALAQS